MATRRTGADVAESSTQGGRARTSRSHRMTDAARARARSCRSRRRRLHRHPRSPGRSRPRLSGPAWARPPPRDVDADDDACPVPAVHRRCRSARTGHHRDRPARRGASEIRRSRSTSRTVILRPGARARGSTGARWSASAARRSRTSSRGVPCGHGPSGTEVDAMAVEEVRLGRLATGDEGRRRRQPGKDTGGQGERGQHGGPAWTGRGGRFAAVMAASDEPPSYALPARSARPVIASRHVASHPLHRGVSSSWRCVLVGACGTISTTPPAPTPADFQGIAAELTKAATSPSTTSFRATPGATTGRSSRPRSA